MLKKLRVGAALLFFAPITLYFLDFAGTLPVGFHGLAHLQIVPALLSLSLGILVLLLIVTLLFGRIYCAVLCPMGVMQDVIGRLANLFRKKRKRFKYSPPRNILRWTLLGVVTISFLLGFTLLLSLLDPYSAYGRIVTNLFRPIYMAGNNLLATLFTKFGNYTFYQVEIYMQSLFTWIVAWGTLLGIGFMAWRYGRAYCNTICPVGTLLGFVSKYALFKIRIDTERCNGCGVCASRCKASCIDPKEHRVDYTRCVDCFNCLDHCKQGAVKLSVGPLKTVPHPQTATRLATASEVQTIDSLSINQQEAGGDDVTSPTDDTNIQDRSRRKFLATLVISALVLPESFAHEKTEQLANSKAHKRKHPLSPPGAHSTAHLQKHCTACQLCVSKCPSRVLKPAFMEYGLVGVMQPTMDFEKGFCNFDCTLCSEVCPNGALRPLSIEEKHLTQMGYVVFDKTACIVFLDETSCGACSEHCPTQAVTMIPYREGKTEGLTIPSIHPDICVGCGGCEYVCPARPFRAIHIEGNPIHLAAKPFERSGKSEIQVDDFGF